MKGIALILSVLMLALSLRPCSDGLNEEHADDVAIEKNHDHSSDMEDSCPSLCICNCCGIAVTFEAIERFDIKLITEIVSQDLDTFYNMSFSHNHLSRIFQPPKA